MRRNQPRQPHASANPDDSDNFSDLSDSDVQLAKRGIYYITDEIEDEGLLHIHQDILLKHLAPDWSDPIQLIINSPGGACSAGWSLIDLLEYVKMPVHTVGLGTIASMAAVLFASGTIGRRMLAPNCEIMVHLPY